MESKEFYDKIPVEYCANARCSSLAIITDNEGIVCCKDCGSVKIEKGHIDVWKEEYYQAHGKYLLDKNDKDYGLTD